MKLIIYKGLLYIDTLFNTVNVMSLNWVIDAICTDSIKSLWCFENLVAACI